MCVCVSLFVCCSVYQSYSLGRGTGWRVVAAFDPTEAPRAAALLCRPACASEEMVGMSLWRAEASPSPSAGSFGTAAAHIHRHNATRSVQCIASQIIHRFVKGSR